MLVNHMGVRALATLIRDTEALEKIKHGLFKIQIKNVYISCEVFRNYVTLTEKKYRKHEWYMFYLVIESFWDN